MARLFSVILLAVCFGVVASAQPGPRVELIAELLSFSENSMFLRFADRTEAWYHSSSFEVLGPDEYCGKSLTIYHEQLPEAGSTWRQVGGVFRLSASAERARDLFDPSYTFIAPAVEIVEEVGANDIRKLRACGNQ